MNYPSRTELSCCLEINLVTYSQPSFRRYGKESYNASLWRAKKPGGFITTDSLMV